MQYPASSSIVVGLMILLLSQTCDARASVPKAPLIQGSQSVGISGLLQDQEGWTVASQFLATEGTNADLGPEGEKLSRIVYVSSSGNDVAAARNPRGRGYYLPGDPEIGTDPTQPSGRVAAYATFGAATKALRLSGNGRAPGTPKYPEWILFERGGSYDLEGVPLNINVSQGGPDPSRRRVFAAYGATSKARPRIFSSRDLSSAVQLWGERGGSNVALMSLDLSSGGMIGLDLRVGSSDILVEDTLLRSLGSAQSGSGNLIFRRNVVHGAHRAKGHIQGLYMQGVGRALLEQNVFDMNGYMEDPFDPSTWTASAFSTLTPGEMPIGTGLQPTRTWFSRNLYLSSYQDLKVVRNIISRGGAGGSVQMRVGGVAEENVFLFNHSALKVGHDQSDRTKLKYARVSRNLVLHDDLLLPPGGYGGGLAIGIGSNQEALVDDNIVAHFHDRKVNGLSMIGLSGLGAYLTRGADERAKEIRVVDNAIIANRAIPIAIASPAAPDGVGRAVIEANGIVRTVGVGAAVTGAQEFSGLSIGASSGRGNRYMTPDWQNYSDWTSRGLDSFSRRFTSARELATASGWRYSDASGEEGWARDIVSYMSAIDPAFRVDEQVTVDSGVPRANQRLNAPKVVDVLVDMGMSPQAARLSARRYHAFLVFIERAKANRKGNWSYQYTSDALNTYIRDGFGKGPITGSGSTPSTE
jgi:hypothetical protein